MKEIKDESKKENENYQEISESRRDKIIKNVILLVVMLFTSFLIALSAKIFEQTKAKAVMKILCDSFFVPGVFVLCAGLLVIISGTGFFSGLKYIGRSVLGVFIPGIRLKQKKYEGYKDKPVDKKKVKGMIMFFVSGASFIVVACVFLIMYYVL